MILVALIKAFQNHIGFAIIRASGEEWQRCDHRGLPAQRVVQRSCTRVNYGTGDTSRNYWVHLVRVWPQYPVAVHFACDGVRRMRGAKPRAPNAPPVGACRPGATWTMDRSAARRNPNQTSVATSWSSCLRASQPGSSKRDASFSCASRPAIILRRAPSPLAACVPERGRDRGGSLSAAVTVG